MVEDAPPERPIVRHPLYIAWSGLILRLSDNGVTPDTEGLHFTRDGRKTYRPYSDLVEVNLAMTSMPRAADIAQMTLRFFDGTKMRVLNTDAWGRADANHNQHYYRFKADLHQRLVESGAAGRIRFTTGVSQGRSSAQRVIMVIAAAFFIGAPIVIFFMTGRGEALLVMLGGIALVLPFMRAMDRNAPASYDPRDPPDMLR